MSCDVVQNRWPYYVVIGLDLVLRFSWTLTLIPTNSIHLFGPHMYLYLTPALGFAELFRRTAWSYFRLENEHLSRIAGIATPDPSFIPKHLNVPDATPDRRGGGGGGGGKDEDVDEKPEQPDADEDVAATQPARSVLIEVALWAVFVLVAALIIYLVRK